MRVLDLAYCSHRDLWIFANPKLPGNLTSKIQIPLDWLLDFHWFYLFLFCPVHMILIVTFFSMQNLMLICFSWIGAYFCARNPAKSDRSIKFFALCNEWRRIKDICLRIDRRKHRAAWIYILQGLFFCHWCDDFY